MPSGVNASPSGNLPTGMVADTPPLAVSITDTVESVELSTYACLPSGVISTIPGPAPTGMVADTVPVAVSITDTVPAALLSPGLAT